MIQKLIPGFHTELVVYVKKTLWNYQKKCTKKEIILLFIRVKKEKENEKQGSRRKMKQQENKQQTEERKDKMTLWQDWQRSVSIAI